MRLRRRTADAAAASRAGMPGTQAGALARLSWQPEPLAAVARRLDAAGHAATAGHTAVGRPDIASQVTLQRGADRYRQVVRAGRGDRAERQDVPGQREADHLTRGERSTELRPGLAGTRSRDRHLARGRSRDRRDRKSTRLNSSHVENSYA